MKNWKLLTAVAGWCCLICNFPAAGQQADTSAIRPMLQYQAFPYLNGVAVSWPLFQRLRLSGAMADSLLAEKNQLLGSLRYQVHEGELLYQVAAQRADDAQRAADRKDVVIDQLQKSLSRARQQSSRPLLLRPQTWSVAGVGFCAGFVVGAGVIILQVVR